MKEKEIKLTYFEIDSIDELAKDEAELLNIAKKTSDSAYAPYSGFHVGAALLLDNGKIVSGNNQENAAYPSGLCAERVAVFSAGANYPEAAVLKLAIYVRSEHKNISSPVSPCGACRQAIAEYEYRFSRPIKILMSGESGKINVVEGIRALLPLMFNPEDVKK